MKIREILLIVSLSVSLYFLYQTNKELNLSKDLVTIKDRTISEHVNKEGELEREVQAHLLSYNTIKKSKDSTIQELKKRLKRNGQVAQIEFIQKKDTVYIDSTLPDLPRLDLNLGRLDAKLSVLSDTVRFSYLYNPGKIYLSTYRKWYKPGKLYGKITFEESNTDIKSYTVVDTKFKPKRLGIGPYVGYDLTSQSFSIGLSIHYSILQL